MFLQSRRNIEQGEKQQPDLPLHLDLLWTYIAGTKKPAPFDKVMRASKSLIYKEILVEPSGIEPLTSTLPVLRSPS